MVDPWWSKRGRRKIIEAEEGEMQLHNISDKDYNMVKGYKGR